MKPLPVVQPMPDPASLPDSLRIYRATDDAVRQALALGAERTK